MATFLQLSKRTWTRAGLSGQGPVDVQKSHDMHGRVVDWVAEAYREVQQLYVEWKFLWREDAAHFIAGKDRYPVNEVIPDNINYLIDTPGLSHLYFADMSNRDNFLNPVAGHPAQVLILPDGTWLLDATPTQDYDFYVQYYRTPHIFSDNDDECIIPDAYEDLVVYKALQYYSLFDEANTQLIDANTQFKTLLVRAERDLLPAMRWADNPFTNPVT